jgi:hypothetical protein
MSALHWMMAAAAVVVCASAAERPKLIPRFQTSDRCLACHNGLQTSSGQDISIGFQWRATMMANSSRDPYWQASVRRESMDHPDSQAEIEDECTVCHMPIVRYEAMLRGRKGEAFAHLPIDAEPENRTASDGVSCSVCHQIGKEKLGTRESFNGGFVVDPPDESGRRPEYGPFEVEKGHERIMRTSTEGYRPTKSDHIRQSELCATCHTLYTKALGPGGKVIGELPEQVPYQEWLHSDYREKKSCQSCHMPVVDEPVAVTRVLGVPREGVARHVFVGGNFFMLGMLNRFRGELAVAALVPELAAAVERTVQFLQQESAKVSIANAAARDGVVEAEIAVENLGGHKLPTAYPSRRAWLHVLVRDGRKQVVFESGALEADGSIRGNDNDSDATRLEPHYRALRSAGEVQIYESVMADAEGRVTTGLLAAVRYLKDNRLLPHGFDKGTAGKDIAVIGDAADDGDFSGAGDRVRYIMPVGGAQGPFTVEAELMYQPVGFRWANNLKKYEAAEARRFNGYYDAMAKSSAVALARAASPAQ